MIGIEDAAHTFEYDEYFKILPAINKWSEDPARIGGGKKVPNQFSYTSNNNTEWMEQSELAAWINDNKNKIGKI